MVALDLGEDDCLPVQSSPDRIAQMVERFLHDWIIGRERKSSKARIEPEVLLSLKPSISAGLRRRVARLSPASAWLILCAG